MPDFGPRWKPVGNGPLSGGGQGKVFLVSDMEGPAGHQYIAKVLNGATLADYNSGWISLPRTIRVDLSLPNCPNTAR